jgi:hypothetical protein
LSAKPNSGSTGGTFKFVSQLEVREIVIAEGVQFHESDVTPYNNMLKSYSDMLDKNPSAYKTDPALKSLAKNTWGTDAQRTQQIKKKLAQRKQYSDILFLEEALAPDFKVSGDRTKAEYINHDQGVYYKFRIVYSLSDFKKALETPELIVVYSGHARYGRGPCFDQYPGEHSATGEQWEDGTHGNNGIFRMGYPFIPVELEDIEHHGYTCKPIPIEHPKPPNESNHPMSRHPEARRTLVPIKVTKEINDHIRPTYMSPSNQYWGYGKHIVFHADWDGTARSIHNLDDVSLECRTFCHFGCSSKIHCWQLIRRMEYKGWSRPKPPTRRLAYFTTATSDWKTAYWLFYLLSFNKPNSETHFFESHEYAVRRANQRLRAEGAGFELF